MLYIYVCVQASRALTLSVTSPVCLSRVYGSPTYTPVPAPCSPTNSCCTSSSCNDVPLGSLSVLFSRASTSTLTSWLLAPQVRANTTSRLPAHLTMEAPRCSCSGRRTSVW
ncbi:hypothetical protein F4808DRAFT_423965 [Astrocystis sublimbata]|nr:hypothetical protein F4808DRAFT_423965 [Astrocystis sublimbata]